MGHSQQPADAVVAFFFPENGCYLRKGWSWDPKLGYSSSAVKDIEGRKGA